MHAERVETGIVTLRLPFLKLSTSPDDNREDGEPSIPLPMPAQSADGRFAPSKAEFDISITKELYGTSIF